MPQPIKPDPTLPTWRKPVVARTGGFLCNCRHSVDHAAATAAALDGIGKFPLRGLLGTSIHPIWMNAGASDGTRLFCKRSFVNQP
jgi:hypothetical protein